MNVCFQNRHITSFRMRAQAVRKIKQGLWVATSGRVALEEGVASRRERGGGGDRSPHGSRGPARARF